MDRLTVSDFFAPGTGVIARKKPDFVARAGQQELSELIISLAETPGKHVLAEAPTGFGKSFAALVPAILTAVYGGKRVVISTETIALQDQYVDKDLPLLQAACEEVGIKFTFAVAKGRSNYVCKIKLDETPGMGQSRFQKWAALQELPQNTGDRASVPFDITNDDWREVGADEDCERKACPFFGEGAMGHSDCFVFAARREYLEADIVVTNHTLLLIDADLGQGALVGPHDLLIVDEAHTLPEQAQRVWGMEIGPGTISSTLRLIDKMLRRSGIDHFNHGFLDSYRSLEDDMFEPLNSVITKGSVLISKVPQTRLEDSKGAAVALRASLVGERKGLGEMKHLSEHQEEVVRAGVEKISKLVRTLNGIYGDAIEDEYKDNWIVFLESKRHARSGRNYCVMHLKPIDIAPLFRAKLLTLIPNVVFMSATLMVNNSFFFMRKEMGLARDDTIEFIGKTPFDYKKQVIGYFPTDLPDPDAPDYTERLAKRIKTIINRRGGQALVLFTSSQLMETVYEAVQGKLKHTAYCQGQASKAALIERFKEETDSCLFATRSFFTGVDIPGDALSNVILTKAPFRVPSDPLFNAKCRKIRERGGNDFSDYSMPLMIMDVRQGFGRLIRTATDTGLFAFLDSRANKKAYGKTIRSSLPAMQVVDVVE